MAFEMAEPAPRPSLENEVATCSFDPDGVVRFPAFYSPTPTIGTGCGSSSKGWNIVASCRMSPVFPSSNPPHVGAPTWIAAGPDGNLWYTTTGQGIAMINPTTHIITRFILPDNNQVIAEGIAAGPDGNLWFTEYDGRVGDMIGMINPTTDAITEFTVHSSRGNNGWINNGITAGPDGNVWFTDPYSNAIGMISPTTHAITEFALPTANAGPRGITAGPDGNIWFTEDFVGKVGEINPTTHAITEFATPTGNSGPYQIAVGSDGNMWFSERQCRAGRGDQPDDARHHRVCHPPAFHSGSRRAPTGTSGSPRMPPVSSASINPMTDTITRISRPLHQFKSRRDHRGPRWQPLVRRCRHQRDRRRDPGLTQLVVTQQPPASLTAGTPFGLTVEAEDSSGNLALVLQRHGDGGAGEQPWRRHCSAARCR